MEKKNCSCAAGFELFGLGPPWELGFAHLQAAFPTDSSVKSVDTLQFCNYSAVLSRTSRTDFRQTRALCVYKTVLTRRTNLFLYVRNSFSVCLPSSFSIYLHHLFFLTFILFSSPFLRHFHPLTLFYFLLLVCLSALLFLLPFILPSYVFFLYISFFFPPYLAFNYIPFATFFHPRFLSCKYTHLPISSQLLAHSSYELHLINV